MGLELLSGGSSATVTTDADETGTVDATVTTECNSN
ncbi:MAG: hypothetical protein K0R21_2065 [Anaerocolumna sp.]|nr:hypothetical protein [Anaerocolumna sp.]